MPTMRIAFFTFNAYDMLTGGHRGNAGGGAQLQQILVGSELASRGHDVYFVEYETDHTEETEIDGIEVVTIPRPTGSELGRALDVFSNARSVLRRLDPDVCYRRVLDFTVVPISVLCEFEDRRFVYGIAHNDELTDNPHMLQGGIKGSRLFLFMIRRALSGANAVIAQNNHQYDLATDTLSTNIRQIPNCYPDNPTKPLDWKYDSPVVFWAARFHEWKQPELVAELAEAIPEATFLMAGGPGDESLYQRLQERTKSIDNLVLAGHIPIAEIDQYFASADVFLNTSESEGFPNTFLQSWVHGTPVVSLDVDPDGILQSNDIGLVAGGDRETLEDHLMLITTDNELRDRLGNASRDYYESNHRVSEIATQYERIFESED